MVNVFHVLASPGAAAVRLLPLLADTAIKGVVVFGVAACAVALCRRRSAATRHAIWAGAVAAQLTLPVLSAFLPAWRVPLVERLDRRLMALAPVTVRVEPAEFVLAGPVSSMDAPVTAIAIAPGVGRGIGVSRAVITPRTIRRADGGSGFAVAAGDDFVVRQQPSFSLIGALRSLRNQTPAWWLRAAAIL